MISEIGRVLNYPRLKERHRLARGQVKALLAAMESLAVLVAGSPEVEVVKEDPSDNMFISCALEASAACIVSGDSHLLSLRSYEGIDILTPAEFLAMLRRR